MINKGRCLCGSVTWELTGEPFSAYNCHCSMCQKTHGTAFGTYYRVKSDQFRWTGNTDTILHYNSSHLTRSSCKTCGSVVPFESKNHVGWAIPAGGHDNGRKADCNIFVADHAPWHLVSNNIPCYDAYPPDSEYLIIEDRLLAKKPGGVVRGSCLCGTITFRVTKPFKIAHNCHCSRCRYARSAAHASNGFTSFDAVDIVTGAGHLKMYKVPDARFFTQAFCDICSSAMPRLDSERGVAVIPLGSLDDDPGIRPADHLNVGNKAGWHDITDDLPIFKGMPPV
jgi:hypothetical protein